MTGWRSWASLGLAAVLVFVAGCAQPLRQTGQESRADVWSGRLALQVEGNQSESFASAFELRGNAQTGELVLTNPLGGTMAQLAWAPGTATLRSGNGQTSRFNSLEELAGRLSGAALPVAALFDWLAGIDTPVPGWKADLSQLAQGRIGARRLEPTPIADLRVALDR